MSLVSGVLERREGPRLIDNINTPLSGANILAAWTGPQTATGKRVSEEGALRIGTVFACVRILTGAVASFPLMTYRRLQPRGKETAVEHPLYAILHDRPNPWMTSAEFRAALKGHKELWGNAFADIMRDDSGRVTGLFPLRPDRMERPVISASGDLLYRYRLPSGELRLLPQVNVLHLRALSSDGIWGYSPVALQREALSLAAIAEEYQGRFFANNAQPSGILSAKGAMSEDAARRLKGEWERAHSGLENAHRVAVLEEGITWQAIGMPLQDAQFLQLREYQRSEIAGWFLVPPHMIGDMKPSTTWGTGLEQQTLGFVNFSLRPDLVNWEQRMSISLLSESERRTIFVEFEVDGLLRGDSAARAAFYRELWGIGALTINDIRVRENMNPQEGGDEPFVPLNFVPLSMAGQAPSGSATTEQLAATLFDEPIERRSQRGRLRLRETFRPLFQHLAGQLVRAEVEAIRKHGLPRLRERAAMDFTSWLRQYHQDELAPLIKELDLPIFRAYAAAVEREILDELGIPKLPDSGEPYAELVAAGFAATYSGKSFGQLRQVARDAEAAGKDVAAAVEERLREWLDTRPGKIADGESVRAGEAFARRAYVRGGVTRFRWRAHGKNCPYCSRLNGKVVGVEQDFIAAGQDYQPDGAERPIRPRHPVKHAPLHGACDCMVVAER